MNGKIELLYRGESFVVVNKPVGSDSEDKGEGSVPFLLKKALNIPCAFPCHRLDKAVSGAMLLSTDEKKTAELSEKVQNRQIEKEYICVCEGIFSEAEQSGIMKDILFFDRKKQKSYTVKKKRAGAKEASLEYTVLESVISEHEKVLSLVLVKLHTGRTHQIRVQFASRGHSLCGDGKYGSRDNKTTVALHCLSLTVDEKKIVCPPKNKYPFDLFSAKYFD